MTRFGSVLILAASLVSAGAACAQSRTVSTADMPKPGVSYISGPGAPVRRETVSTGSLPTVPRLIGGSSSDVSVSADAYVDGGASYGGGSYVGGGYGYDRDGYGNRDNRYDRDRYGRHDDRHDHWNGHGDHDHAPPGPPPARALQVAMPNNGARVTSGGPAAGVRLAPPPPPPRDGGYGHGQPPREPGTGPAPGAWQPGTGVPRGGYGQPGSGYPVRGAGH
jgi:hypothetical protein